MALRVLDVSDANGSIDFDRVKKSGVAAIYIRAADGDHHDTFYTRARVDAIRKVGLPFGPYYYARVASPANGQRTGQGEYRMAVRHAKAAGWGRAHDLRFAYDFEDLNGQSPHKAGQHLIEFITAYHHGEGHWPAVYTMPGLWDQVRPTLSQEQLALVERCPLWEADWGVHSLPHLAPWGHAFLWQTSGDKARWPGVGGAVDLDLAFNLRDLRRLARAGIVEHASTHPAPHPHPKPRPAPRPHLKGVPGWLPARYDHLWLAPWSRDAALSRGFHKVLWSHGLLSPHFTRAEAACKNGVAVPGELRGNAQRHAFQLERFRHELGDIPVSIISWYRTPAYNAQIGGATRSRHMAADATDHSREWVDRVGRARVMAAAEKVCKADGLGVYPWGSVHLDSRGFYARWNDWSH